MKKRIIALVVAVVMALSTVPFAAFAEPATNPYDAGVTGAYYLLDVPAANLDANHTTEVWDATLNEGEGGYATYNGGTLTYRTENGENFFVYSGMTGVANMPRSSELQIPQITYGQASGIPASITFNQDLTTSYLAIRVKINDNAPAYDFKTTAFRIEARNEADDVISPITNSKWYNYKFLNLEDGSLMPFRANSGILNGNANRFEFSGDVDGYILVPFTNTYIKNSNKGSDAEADTETVNLIDPAVWSASLNSLRFYFDENEHASSGNTSNKGATWDNKELLLGDIMFVNDINAFATAKSVKYSTADKYSPNVGDTASYALKVEPTAAHTQLHGNKLVSRYVSAPLSFAGGPGGGYYSVRHIVKLPNEDLAYNLTVAPSYRTDAATKKISISNRFTYENTAVSEKGMIISSSNGVFDNTVPSQITTDGKNIKAFAIRIAIKDGDVANEAYKLKLQLGYTDNDTDTWSQAYVGGEKVQFMDAATGVVSEIPVVDNVITFADDVDGWLIVNRIASGEATGTNNVVVADNVNWGDKKGSTSSFLTYHLVEGFANAQTVYAGDVMFVEDTTAFKQYHCPHTATTPGTPQTATCQQGSFTPVTCNNCGHVEKTNVGGTVACSYGTAWVDGTDGYHYHVCQWCGTKDEATKEAHKGGTQTCKDEAICSECNVAYGGLSTTHTWATTWTDGQDGYHYHLCTICGTKDEATKEAHKGGTATCKDKAVCTECNVAYGELSTIHAFGTEWKDGEDGNHYHLCAVCGTKDEATKEAHKGGTATCKDKAVCSECAAKYGELAAHDMKKADTIAPTATEKGYDLYECEVCEETEQKNFVDALGEVEEEEDKSPATGESDIFAIAMLLTAALGAVVLFTSKKRATR